MGLGWSSRKSDPVPGFLAAYQRHRTNYIARLESLRGSAPRAASAKELVWRGGVRRGGEEEVASAGAAERILEVWLAARGADAVVQEGAGDALRLLYMGNNLGDEGKGVILDAVSGRVGFELKMRV